MMLCRTSGRVVASFSLFAKQSARAARRGQTTMAPAAVSFYSSLSQYKLDFGKHRGKSLEEVPTDYVDWLTKEMVYEKRPELKEALKQIGKNVELVTGAAGGRPGSTAATGSGSGSGSRAEQLWASWRDNPSEWWDNRERKYGPTSPDFRHKDTREGLWIDSKNTPQWVRDQLGISG